MEKLLEIYKIILASNPTAALSGSCALKLHNVSLAHEPKGIDVYIPRGHVFIDKIPGLIYDQNIRYENTDNHLTYQYEGIKVDVFICPDQDGDLRSNVYNGISLVEPYEIIKFKIDYCFDHSESRFKHRDDVIHILQHTNFDNLTIPDLPF